MQKEINIQQQQFFNYMMDKHSPKEKKRLSFVIDEDEFLNLEKICKTFKISKTDFLRLMIKTTVDNIK